MTLLKAFVLFVLEISPKLHEGHYRISLLTKCLMMHSNAYFQK